MKISKTFYQLINYRNVIEYVDSFEVGIQKLKDDHCHYYKEIREVIKTINLDTFNVDWELVQFAEKRFGKVHIEKQV